MINLPAVLIANGIAVVLLVTLLISACNTVHFRLLDNKLFYTMIFCVLLQCVVESGTFLIDGKAGVGIHVLALVLNAVLFSNSVIFGFVWTLYVDFKLFGDKDRLRRVYPIVAIPAVLVILGSLINLFTPVFFQVSDDNVYQRTGLYLVAYLLTYLYMSYGVVLIYFYRTKVRKYLFMPAVVFVSPILLGSVLQLFFYGLSLVWVSVAVALVSLYMNVQNEASSIDDLSGLFNRQYLNHYLYTEARKSGTKKVWAGIMLDIDQFKQINDEFGHLMGDEAITAAGKILRGAISQNDLAARYAGDEFVIISQSQNESDVQKIIQRIQQGAQAFCAEEKRPYTLQFSIGYTFFQGTEDSVEAFLSRMDAEMYVEKREKKH